MLQSYICGEKRPWKTNTWFVQLQTNKIQGRFKEEEMEAHVCAMYPQYLGNR